MVEVSELDDEQLEQLGEAIREEQRRRYILVHAPEQMEKLVEKFQEVSGVREGSEFKTPVTALDAVPPGARRTYEGKLYENTSGGYLSHSPAEVPHLWTEVVEEEPEEPGEEPEPDGYDDWAPGQDYAVGKILNHKGTLYVVIQGHTSQAGWEPQIVPALYGVV